MGRPKLLLPWEGGTIIEAVLRHWQASQVARIAVVVRHDDPDLAGVCSRFDVDLIVPPVPPPEMKVSVQRALEHLAERYQPGDDDYWLLAPADLPRLSTATIDTVISRITEGASGQIVAPVHAGRRGHPVAFPWGLAPAVRDIPAGQGIRWLLRERPILECAAGPDAIAADLDTWNDYLAARGGMPDNARDPSP